MTALRPEDLANPATFARPDDVRALFARLRETAPVTRVEPKTHPPFWLVTRHDDVKAIENDPETFLAGTRTILQPLAQEASNLATFGDINGLKTLVHMDGEEHRKHRIIAQSFFSRTNIEKLRAQTRAQAKVYVDKMAAMGGACDFAGDIAFWFPLRVVLSLMGVPPEDDPKILDLTQKLFGFFDPDVGVDDASDAAALPAVIAAFAGVVNTLIAARRETPTDDLASVLAHATIDGQPIDGFKQLSYFILVTTAGNDTTSASIAEGMKALIENPDTMAQLKSDLSLLPNAADEFIRLAAPVKHFLRTPTKDVVIAGQPIRAGETIMLSFDAAARDPAHFSAPDKPTLTRPVNQHLAFGFGPHVCLGKYLARMEAEEFFAELLPRLDEIALAGPVDYMQGGFVSGIKKMPVTYRMR